MSIKVLLVDDEKLERVLIRKGFDWEKHGFEIIGEASSGKEALEYVEHRKPEIVLTDISMPHMDGLELAEKILEKSPFCHIVIVTGYREFEYARRAVRIGVEDFLLKPVNMNDIAEITENIKGNILKERQQVEKEELLKASILADKDIVMESFFQRLVVKRIPKEEAIRKLMLYSCESLSDNCICLNIRLKENENVKRYEIEHEQILDYLKSERYQDSVCFVHYMQNIILYIINQEYDTATQIADKIHTSVKDKWGISTTIGISSRNYGYEGISKAFEESEKALSVSVFLGRNRCVTYQEYQEVMNQNQNSKEIDWEDFAFAITNSITEKTSEFVKEYVNLIRASKVTDIEYLRLMTMNMLSKAGATLNKYGIGLTQLIGENRLFEEVRAIDTVDEIYKYLNDKLNQIMKFHESKRIKRGNKVVEEALAFVNNNIVNPDLSLKLVASNVYSNESYLSRAFKKEMGVSLIEYISKKRIEESIQLLNTTDLKVYEIAEKIGFRDSHYFSICFKKQTGLTVKEFRK